MSQPQVRLCHRNRLMRECLSAALNESGIVDCSILVFDDLNDHDFQSLTVAPFDLLLLDASFERDLTRQIASQVRDALPTCKIVLLVSEQAIVRMTELARIANHGLLFEGTGFTEVLFAIKAVLSGESFYSSQLTKALMSQMCHDASVTDSRQDRDDQILTPREQEILDLISKERLCNKQIARLLGISLYTVKNHIHNIIDKLGVHDRHEAAQMGRRRNQSSIEPNLTSERVVL